MEPDPPRGDGLTRVGVLGLGRMGLPVARRLAAAVSPGAVPLRQLDAAGPPWAVLGFDPHPERLAAARTAGLPVAASESEVAAWADVLVLALPGSAEVAALAGVPTPSLPPGDQVPPVDLVLPVDQVPTVAGTAEQPRERARGGGEAGGRLEGMRAGSVVLDLTSTDPRVAERAAGACAARGVGWVGSPMGGGAVAAERGGLTFVVGGHDDEVQRVRPLLEALADPHAGGGIEVAGPGAGDGCTAKLLVNSLWFGQAAAVAEALLVGRRQGLEADDLLRILSRSAAASALLADYGQAIVDGETLPVFGLDRVVEELEIVRGLARDAAVDTPVAETVARLHRDALAEFGPVDGELLAVRLLEQRAGFERDPGGLTAPPI